VVNLCVTISHEVKAKIQSLLKSSASIQSLGTARTDAFLEDFESHQLKVLLVRPAKADAFSGRQSRRGKSQSLAAWMAGRRETDDLKPIDKSHRKDDGESPGRSVSERIGGLENFQPRKPNLQVLGEGSMGTADWLARGSIPTG